MSINQYRSMLEALEDLRKRGYKDEFTADKDGLRIVETGEVVSPKDIVIVEHHRFEGDSNPSDMSVVYAMETADGRRGVYIDAFGTYSDPLAIDVLKRIRVKEDIL